MENHFIPEGAKRRRLQETRGATVDAAATCYPSMTPVPRFGGDSVCSNDSGGVFASQLNLYPSAALTQPETSPQSQRNQPAQGTHGADGRRGDMTDQYPTSSSLLASNCEFSSMMAGETWNGVSIAQEYSTPQCIDWNIGGQTGQADLDQQSAWTNYGQPNHHFLAPPIYVEAEPNYSAFIHSYGANPIMQSSEPIRSHALNTEVPFQTQMAVATQANQTIGFESNISCTNNGTNGLVQVPSGADRDEFVCFGMVGTFKFC
jgi:hypothetical protein